MKPVFAGAAPARTMKPCAEHSDTSLFCELLTRQLAGILELGGDQLKRLYDHYQLLERWNAHLNLTAIRDLETAVVRHYCESLFLGISLPGSNSSIGDLGSGAGFPGIPMAVVRPDCRITLIDSNRRKGVFLKEATRNLCNVEVVVSRAEELKDRYDWVVSRAVSTEEVLRHIPRLALQVGMLLGEIDASKAMKIKTLEWKEPIRIPWGKRQVVLLGSWVPRETPR